uniref:Uncharacterized protein n=1 Tax=Anguilla anguilla TaxID=7936 RepID=A0A0E9VGL4_ANGAN
MGSRSKRTFPPWVLLWKTTQNPDLTQV